MTEHRRDTGRRGLPDLFDWAENLPGLLSWPPQMNPRGIRVEEYVQDGRYVVRAELPGVDPDRDVHIQVENGVLVIQAERREEHRDEGRSEFRYGTFTRRIQLPPGTDESQVVAKYTAGILEVTLPVSERRQEARRIPIQH